MSRFLTTNEFIDRAKKVHGDLYDYSNTLYTSSKDKVNILCLKHGIFSKRADKHLLGEGCPKCANNSPSSNDFIEKCKIIHNNIYNYDKTIYKTRREKITVTCLIHGDFIQTADRHITGGGCPTCGNLRKGILHPLSYYLDQAIIIHDNKYDYSKIEYVTSKQKVKIICPIHGEFEQTLQNHVNNKHGCPLCGKETTEFITKSTDDFIKDAIAIHGKLYDYSLVNYVHSFTKVKIICQAHGVFEQLPSNHLSGNGCPICNSSKGELLIYNWLSENNIPFKREYELITPEIARNSNLMRIDFFVKYNNQQYFIEYDGIQHYEYVPFFHKNGIEDFENQLRRDKVLEEFCELHKNKVILLRFKYNLNDDNIIEILNNKIKNNGKTINT